MIGALQNEWQTVIIVCSIVGLSYTAFALTGYGGAALATPFLALLLPVTMVVPFLAVLDVVAASINVARFFADGGYKRFQEKVDLTELGILSPPLVLGSYIGASFLGALPGDYLLLALGIFVFITTVQNLRAKNKPRMQRLANRHLVAFGIFAGFVGGILSGTFGIGGPVYVIYLSNRLDAAKVPGTLGTLIGIAALARSLIFLHQGLYAAIQVRAIVALALPFLLFGMLGTHFLTRSVPTQSIIRYLRYLLLVVSISIMARAMLHLLF